jgi:predicted ABC-class ATPase
MRDLEAILHRIDGRGYKAYKEIEGRRFRFENFDLLVEHVQGDPYAAPSKLRALVPVETAALPATALASPARRRATRDFLARAFRAASGRHREIAIDAGRQTVLDRSACLIDAEAVELRFTIDLPGARRRVLGRKAASLLVDLLPGIIDSSALARDLDLEALEHHAAVVEDQEALRAALVDADLVAFIGNGAILPRRSGIDDHPLRDGVRCVSPPSLEVVLETPNAGPVRGMGIPHGVTLIVGGGFHGKSTLLRAVETGIWDHIPGDGRELVVSDPGAVKIRAEDGRAVHAVDISDFISHLPGGRGTSSFTTDLASGSTSQAASLVEALETGATVLLLDEDTSATNFMIRDRRMQALVAKTSEPITPFVDRIRELREELGVSTLLVMGGSGDYFDHADVVIQMADYLPRDVTGEARRIAAELATGRDTLIIGRSDIDLRAVEQLQDSSQLRSIGWILGRLSEAPEPEIEPLAHIEDMLGRLGRGEWDWLTGYPDGDLAVPRPHEVMAALNRLRGARWR